MDKTLKPFWSTLSAVNELDTKVKDAVKEAFSELREQLTTDIENRFGNVESRLTTLEQSPLFDKDAAQNLVELEIQMLKKDLEMQLETKVKQMVEDDRGHQHCKLNIKILKDEYSKIGLSFKPEKSEVILFNW